MKGIILAGGKGTRLQPMTLVTNKHLLPVYDRPMIFYPVETLVKAGITDIMIITGSEYAGDFINLLGNGEDFGAKFTYRVQKEAGGIAHALGLCRDFAEDEPIAVILGDNIFEDDITIHVNKYKQDHRKGMVFLKEVKDPQRFGVPTIDNGILTDIVEKPRRPSCNYAVTGLYFFNPAVWHIIENLKPSDRGELEITEVNNWFIDNLGLDYQILSGFWGDAGTVESLYQAGTYARKKHK